MQMGTYQHVLPSCVNAGMQVCNGDDKRVIKGTISSKKER